jgi:hypothetical protein
MSKVLFYKQWTDPEFDLYDDANRKYTDWLVGPCSWLQKFLDVVHPKINYVKIDRWDTWSMDHTLSPIILPMLKQLKETKHGSPYVDDEDVPDELKSTSAPPRENDWDIDDNHHLRWDWVMDEMIFAFECKVDDSWEDAFRSGEIDTIWVKTDEKILNPVTGKEEITYQMTDGPNHTYKCDYEGMKKVQQRIDNGFRLFGKYYQSLWD